MIGHKRTKKVEDQENQLKNSIQSWQVPVKGLDLNKKVKGLKNNGEKSVIDQKEIISYSVVEGSLLIKAYDVFGHCCYL